MCLYVLVLNKALRKEQNLSRFPGLDFHKTFYVSGPSSRSQEILKVRVGNAALNIFYLRKHKSNFVKICVRTCMCLFLIVFYLCHCVCHCVRAMYVSMYVIVCECT